MPGREEEWDNVPVVRSTVETFFVRGKQVARRADRGEPLEETRLLTAGELRAADSRAHAAQYAQESPEKNPVSVVPGNVR